MSTPEKKKLQELQALIDARDFMTHSVEEYIGDEMKVHGLTRDKAIDSIIKGIKAHPVL